MVLLMEHYSESRILAGMDETGLFAGRGKARVKIFVPGAGQGKARVKIFGAGQGSKSLGRGGAGAEQNVGISADLNLCTLSRKFLRVKFCRQKSWYF